MPHWYSQDGIKVIPANSVMTGNQPEGSLYTESASDSQVTFFTSLHLPSCDRTKHITIEIDPGAQVNTIPLSKYHALFPNKLNKSRFPKSNALLPTAHTWMAHDGSPKPFLGHFVAEVMHASEPRLYLTHFYVFKDATSPQILLSYATSERLENLTFSVPKLAATSWVDNVAISTSPSQGGVSKTAKIVTFQDPLVETSQPPCSTATPTPSSGRKKTASFKVIFATTMHIKGSKCKSPPQQLFNVPLSPSLYIASAPPPRCSHLR